MIPCGGDDAAEALGVAVSGEVERVSDDEMGRQNLPQLCRQRAGQRADPKPVVRRDVRRDDRRSSGARDDEHPRSGGSRHVGEGLREVIKLLERSGAVDAELPEDGVVDLVLPGQRPGVRLGGLAPLLGPARLENHDGLPARPDGGQKTRGVLHAFDVKRDHLRVRVGAEELDQIGFVDVDPVAHAHERREPEPLLGRPVDERRPDRSALRSDGHRALAGDEGPGRAEAMVRVVHALTVRPDHTDSAPGRVLLDLLLQTRPVGPRFGEASGDDDGGPHLPLAELEDGAGDTSCRNDDDGQIGA